MFPFSCLFAFFFNLLFNIFQTVWSVAGPLLLLGIALMLLFGKRIDPAHIVSGCAAFVWWCLANICISVYGMARCIVQLALPKASETVQSITSFTLAAAFVLTLGQILANSGH